MERRPKSRLSDQILSLNIEALQISHGLKVQPWITVYATHKGHLIDEIPKIKLYSYMAANNTSSY